MRLVWIVDFSNNPSTPKLEVINLDANDYFDLLAGIMLVWNLCLEKAVGPLYKEAQQASRRG